MRTLSFLFFLSSFLPSLKAMPCDLWELSSWPGSNLWPLHWEQVGLTTGPPGAPRRTISSAVLSLRGGPVQAIWTLRPTTKIKSVLLLFLFPGLYWSSECHRISVLFIVFFFFCIYVLEFIESLIRLKKKRGGKHCASVCLHVSVYPSLCKYHPSGSSHPHSASLCLVTAHLIAHL